MIECGEEARVIYSKQLHDMRLISLVGQRGVIVKCILSGRTPGAFILIDIGKNKGEEWFIPIQSIQTATDVDRLRNTAILKSTKI